MTRHHAVLRGKFMLPITLKLKLVTTAAVGLASSASPAPQPAEAMAVTTVERASLPIEVKLFDENLGVHATVGIRRDGMMDEQTAAELKHLFRCRQTNREHAIARGTLASRRPRRTATPARSTSGFAAPSSPRSATICGGPTARSV